MKSAMEKSAIEKKGKSPYLTQGRLEDIIHAVTAMGLHPRAALALPKWDGKLGKPSSDDTDTWGEVFSDHPEFFHVRDNSISLQLRHTYEKTYDAKHHVPRSPSEVKKMLEDGKKKDLTTRPLKIDEIELLLRTAIELHSRAIAQQEEGRWCKARVLTAICAAIGVWIGSAIQWLLSTCSRY